MELAKVKVQELKWTQSVHEDINLYAWNHCPGFALSPKWLENYLEEPHASSEILTRSDLTASLNP